MPIVSIENVGRLGIISDVDSYELPPEAWSDGQNFRFINDSAEKIEGEIDVFTAPSIPPHWLLPWQFSTGFRWIYAGTTRVFFTDGTTNTVITRHTTTDGDANYTAGTRPIWTGGNLHGVPILNHNNDTDDPQQYDAALSPPRLKDLDNWPASTTCKIMRPFRNFLVALDITKTTTRFPYLVKWSHPADPGAVPVSWDETDATKLAGEQTIAQTGGFLVDASPLNDLLAIYKEDAIWTMQPIQGIFVFAFKQNSQTIGALAPRCIANFYRRDFVVGTNDIIIFDGLTPTSIINKKMREFFFRNVSSDHIRHTFVVPNHPYREMWVCYVEQGNTFINKALIWNYDDNTWTIRELPDVNFISFGEVPEAATDTFNDSSGVSFDNETTQFGESSQNVAELNLLMARGDGATDKFYKGNRGHDFDGTAFISYLERTGLAVVGKDRQGNPKTDPAQVKFVRALYPKITSAPGATINIFVGSHDTPDGPVTYQGPLAFNPDTDVRVDCRVQGKFIAVRFEDASTTVAWSISGYELDLDVVAGL